MMSVKSTVCAVLMSCCLVSAVKAEVLFDNLGYPSVGADGALAHGPLYASFSTVGANTLTDVSLLIGADNPNDGGTFTIGLFSDSSTSPGSLLTALGTFDDFQLSSSLAVFSDSVSYSLSAGTRYWIGISSSDGSVYWSYEADDLGLGVAGEFYDNQGGVSLNSDGAYQMELVAGTVPEPSSWAMMVIGFMALGYFRFRTSRRPAGYNVFANLVLFRQLTLFLRNAVFAQGFCVRFITQ